MTRKPVKEVKAWALVDERGRIDTAWITKMRQVQVMRRTNRERYMGMKDKIVRVSIKVIP